MQPARGEGLGYSASLEGEALTTVLLRDIPCSATPFQFLAMALPALQYVTMRNGTRIAFFVT